MLYKNYFLKGFLSQHLWGIKWFGKPALLEEFTSLKEIELYLRRFFWSLTLTIPSLFPFMHKLHSNSQNFCDMLFCGCWLCCLDNLGAQTTLFPLSPFACTNIHICSRKSNISRDCRWQGETSNQKNVTESKSEVCL